MADAKQHLLELLQGEKGSTFQVLSTGWDDSTDGEYSSQELVLMPNMRI